MGRSLIFLLVIAVFFFAYMRYFEHNSLYFPAKEIEATPAAIKLGHEEIYLNTKDKAIINCWFVPADGTGKTVLFCHGNAGNIGDRLEKIAILNNLGLNVFIFDYRGYGNSKGMPSEKGLYIDADAAYDYLMARKNILQKDIIIYGESLGAAVAADLAAKRGAAALIIESGFSSAKDMARRLYPFFPSFLIYSRFDSEKKIKNVLMPKLILHSMDDDIVPFSQSLKLFDAASGQKRHVVLRGGHNSCVFDSRDIYEKAVKDFVELI